MSGQVGLFHKGTKTFIISLYKEQYFGEISFFTGRKRTCTVRSTDYTDCLTIKREDFLLIAYEFTEAINHFYSFHDFYNDGSKNYNKLSIKCYICEKVGHIALDCTYFPQISGNLKRKKKKPKKDLIEHRESFTKKSRNDIEEEIKEEENESTEGGNAYYNR